MDLPRFAAVFAALWAVLAVPAIAAPAPEWRLTRDAHYDIYSQSSDLHALAILTWFEQLRAFFDQQGALDGASSSPVRVVVFASEQEYQPYRLRSNADAYFVGHGDQTYIVMGTDDPGRFRLAAHEYAHLVLRDSYQELPPWLKEGLSEFLSTLRITQSATELGGALPGRLHVLKTRSWMPLADLMSLSDKSQNSQGRNAADLFYAESWALVEMLMLSPKYASFQKLLASSRFDSETLDPKTLTRDLHEWLSQPNLPVVRLPEIVTPPVRVEVSDVPPAAMGILLGQVALAAGEFDRAEALFSALDGSADVSAGLGAIALHKGDFEGARRAWKRAIDQGITDAKLCFNYALLADQAGLPAGDVRPALERAIALEPDFDDARYQLALLEKNAGRYEAALQEFRAMRIVSDGRAFSYWIALADTFNELGRRDDAVSAARQASELATTPAERARAAQQSYIAQTNLAVQFDRDAAGRLQLVTTRAPHQKSDWNPFIEPSDDIQNVQGTLREIECGKFTTVRVEVAGKLLKLGIPDLQHVQMRHAPLEFVCGPQLETSVTVDYARTPNGPSDGIVRGMDFNPAPVNPAGAP